MTPRARLSLFERLVRAHPACQSFNRVDPDSDCWVWPGARDAKGYGLIKHDGKSQRVHRVAYELATGRKLGRLTLDHQCRNPSCWRPSHGKPMSRSRNTAKGNRDNPRSTEKARAALRAYMRPAIAELDTRHFSFKCDGSVRADPPMPTFIDISGTPYDPERYRK